MRLLNGILRPGAILEVLEDGKIKASAPGLFSKEDKDLNPPIMPFFELIGTHPNSFSTPKIGDEIWVLNLTDNPLQLYWFRKDDHIVNNKEIFEETGQANVEILCNIESNIGYASIYFSDGTGWVIKNDDSKLQIFPDGSIELGMNFPYRKISINTNGINLGGDIHSACYGDKTSEVLSDIYGILEQLCTAAKSSPYTSALVPPLAMASIQKNKIVWVESPHVKMA